jgi:short-subunit dehydrogenase
MNHFSITGGSGNIATEVIKVLRSADCKIDVFSRDLDVCSRDDKVSLFSVVDYAEAKFNVTSNKLLICNGLFSYSKFEDLNLTEIEELINANYTVVVKIIHQFLKATNPKIQRDIFILGSSAAYDLGSNVGIYASTKLALTGLVSSLNKEYRESNTRFTIISTGTINNEMGLKVPGQTMETLLNPTEVASQIASYLENISNSFQPEVLIRRRFMQGH